MIYIQTTPFYELRRLSFFSESASLILGKESRKRFEPLRMGAEGSQPDTPMGCLGGSVRFTSVFLLRAAQPLQVGLLWSPYRLLHALLQIATPVLRSKTLC